MSDQSTTAGPAAPPTHHHKSFWLWVMCLTGVDYFSTLGYQPSIAFEATGLLAPLATILLVLMTLFGALPVYRYVARQSPTGLGSIGMLEKLVHGWGGKLLILCLLGFAATDFVITKTLSAADAAEHLLANPLWPVSPKSIPLHRQQLWVTFCMLVFLGATFLRGFKEVIGLAVVIVGIYLLLNVIVIGSGVLYLSRHPDRIQDWWAALEKGPDAWRIREAPPVGGTGLGTVVLLCILLFPKLALGLSGFETGVAVMPLIRGRPKQQAQEPTTPTTEEQTSTAGPHRPREDPEELAARARNTGKLLLTAALIMSVLLLGSATVVSTLIPADDLIGPKDRPYHERDTSAVKPRAKDRALAYIAHGDTKLPLNPLFGPVFGTIYDIATIVILWFAGASAMAGLLNLVPQYLPRYGMAPEWARALRPLVMLFTAVNLGVTWIFDASVSKQGAAYATGVLVLMSSACVATVIQRWRDGAGHWLRRTPWGFGLITLVFLYTTSAIIIEKPVGIKIASFFVLVIVLSSIVSRTVRSREWRILGFRFKDEQSRFLWDSMKFLEFPVLVPHRPGRRGLADKEASIRQEHRLTPDIPIVFIEAELGDVSEFWQEPIMEVRQEEGRFILQITNCGSIPHVLAAVAMELSKVGKPPEIHFGWSDESPLFASLSFVLFGEGNVPWLVRELIRKAEPNPERQPRVIVG